MGTTTLVGELCAAPRVLKEDKVADTIVAWMVDGWKRGAAREAAASQDAVRRHVADNRFDVNSYPGAPPCHPPHRPSQKEEGALS